MLSIQLHIYATILFSLPPTLSSLSKNPDYVSLIMHKRLKQLRMIDGTTLKQTQLDVIKTCIVHAVWQMLLILLAEGLWLSHTKLQQHKGIIALFFLFTHSSEFQLRLT